MNILICSDGSEQAENALRFGALIAAGAHAPVTLLGVVEKAGDEAPLLDALRRGMHFAKEKGIDIDLVTKNGEPVLEIQKHTSEKHYDLVIIGATYKGHSGPFVMSVKAYKLIKVIKSAVLVVTGRRNQLQRMLICSGGGSYIDTAIDLACQIAPSLEASVTLLHVLPETPAMYDAIMDDMEDEESLLTSSSALGKNLRREKEMLEKAGVKTEIRVRHGDVAPQILQEVLDGNYDLVVAGSSPVGGAFRTYLMGNVTSEIVNRAQCPVLVVRGTPPRKGNFLSRLLGIFRRNAEKNDQNLTVRPA